MLDQFLLYAPLAVCLFCLWRCYVPPQTRAVNDLRDRTAALEDAYEAVAARMTKRAKAENLEGARSIREERAARRDAIEEQAAAILAQGQATATQAALPLDDKAALRRHLLTLRGGKASA